MFSVLSVLTGSTCLTQPIHIKSNFFKHTLTQRHTHFSHQLTYDTQKP